MKRIKDLHSAINYISVNDISNASVPTNSADEIFFGNKTLL
jgi:hypothetical protein